MFLRGLFWQVPLPLASVFVTRMAVMVEEEMVVVVVGVVTFLSRQVCLFQHSVL